MTTERPAVSAPIVLPRPNLGPEPWPDSPAWPGAWPWALVAAPVLLAFVMGLRLRRARKRATVSDPPDSPDQMPPPTPPTSIPEDRVREALFEAFGPGLRARTTEEIAASPALGDRFGPEVAARVGAYLAAVDRAKFSGIPGGPDDELAWWADRFVEEVEAGRGRGSMTDS